MRVCLAGSGKSGVPSDRCFCFLDRRNITWSNNVPRRRRQSSRSFFHGIYIDRNYVSDTSALSVCDLKPEFAFPKTHHSNPAWYQKYTSVIWAWWVYSSVSVKCKVFHNNILVWLKLSLYTHWLIERKNSQKSLMSMHTRRTRISDYVTNLAVTYSVTSHREQSQYQFSIQVLWTVVQVVERSARYHQPGVGALSVRIRKISESKSKFVGSGLWRYFKCIP